MSRDAESTLESADFGAESAAVEPTEIEGFRGGNIGSGREIPPPGLGLVAGKDVLLIATSLVETTGGSAIAPEPEADGERTGGGRAVAELDALEAGPGADRGAGGGGGTRLGGDGIVRDVGRIVDGTRGREAAVVDDRGKAGGESKAWIIHSPMLGQRLGDKARGNEQAGGGDSA